LARLEANRAPIDPQLELYEQVEALVQAIETLPRAERDALLASWLEGLSPTEIAERFGVTVNAVHVRLHRARERLSQALGGRRPARTLTFSMPPGTPSANDDGGRRQRTWFMAGSHPADYAFERISNRAGALRCRIDEPNGFGTLMQRFKADAFRGHRVALTGQLRGEGIDGHESWGGLWMRVDAEATPGIAFDNMQERAIRGATPWLDARVVLEISPRASTISVGTLLAGRGHLEVRNLTLSEVGRDVAVTALAGAGPLLSATADLDLPRVGTSAAGAAGTAPDESAYG
jgi:hypothetical protein